MANISMRVELENDSDATLSLVEHRLERGGEWQDDKSPPMIIGPRSTAGWHAAATNPLVGIEGYAIYGTGGTNPGNIRIGWNSPLVESIYGNTFPTILPDGWDVALWGGQGRSGVLNVRVRPTQKRRVAHFMPSICGMNFSNSGTWSPYLDVMTLGYIFNELSKRLSFGITEALDIRPLSDDAMPVTQASQGVCGGMVFAVMDYFYAHQLPPDDPAPPATENAMFRYFRDRLRDSFDFAGRGERWLLYSAPLYPDSDSSAFPFFGRSWITYRQEWPLVRAEIDAGRLAPLGLVQTKSMKIGDNHTVLAYAYEASGSKVRLWIYDPNRKPAPDDAGDHARDDYFLEFDTARTDGPVQATKGTSRSSSTIVCMFLVGGYVATPPVGGRQADQMSLRQAHLREVGDWPAGVVPADIAGYQRPMAVRDWMRAMGP